MEVGTTATTRSYLVRDREVVATLTDFTPVIREMELHFLTLGVQFDPFVFQLLTDGITALGLHLSSRPLDEHTAWTVSIQNPWPINLFFAGSSRFESVVARAFLENVRERDRNVFVSQTRREFGKDQTSYIDVDGVDLFDMVEKFYEQSEQKRARFFQRKPYSAMLQALPSCDFDWLESVDRDEVLALPDSPRVEPLAERHYRFHCGCSVEVIAKHLVGASQGNPESIFEGEDEVEVTCERCGAPFRITREDYLRARDE